VHYITTEELHQLRAVVGAWERAGDGEDAETASRTLGRVVGEVLDAVRGRGVSDEAVVNADLQGMIAALREALQSEGGEICERVTTRAEESFEKHRPPPLVVPVDVDGIDEDESEEAQAAAQRFAWYVRLEVCGTWVADGFNLTDERALDMLAKDLAYADMGFELAARVIAAPPPERIAACQGG